MKATVVERRAELLRLYTGLPWKTALARVEASAPGSLLIPEADAGQMVLEARMMAALAWRQITTVHPWGITYVDPRPDRLTIRFEPDVEGPREGEDTQALDLAKTLLPRADEYGQITGVPGARPHIENGKVVLRLLGTTASVTFLGVDADQWRRAVDAQDQEMSTWGMTPCHQGRPDRLHPAERPYRRPGRTGAAASDWLTSGLLRRAGLVRSLGVPLAVTGWLNCRERSGGKRWIIDPAFAEGHGATGHRTPDTGGWRRCCQRRTGVARHRRGRALQLPAAARIHRPVHHHRRLPTGGPAGRARSTHDPPPRGPPGADPARPAGPLRRPEGTCLRHACLGGPLAGSQRIADRPGIRRRRHRTPLRPATPQPLLELAKPCGCLPQLDPGKRTSQLRTPGARAGGTFADTHAAARAT
ncbi:hypothetical protein AB0D97_28150 [Streptomyces roseus]|uniref:hypothetical protein n=1 Tax=Streptomyces roseus TaxID=66430 RepID=UPI0033E69419